MAGFFAIDAKRRGSKGTGGGGGGYGVGVNECMTVDAFALCNGNSCSGDSAGSPGEGDDSTSVRGSDGDTATIDSGALLFSEGK